jgi:membrane associated rhomboid family serine protease
VGAIIVGAGLLLWLAGRGGRYHIGASGLVFGLIGFLIASGFFERRLVPLLISIFVGFMYGGSLLMGVLPTDATKSWEGHLFGAAVGIALAYLFTRPVAAARREQLAA